jgi:hypothetical protein
LDELSSDPFSLDSAISLPRVRLDHVALHVLRLSCRSKLFAALLALPRLRKRLDHTGTLLDCSISDCMKELNIFQAVILFLISAFSQAVVVDRTVYVSGQIGFNPEVGRSRKHTSGLNDDATSGYPADHEIGW